MTITYKVMNQEPKPWGVDLTTRFDDNETDATIFKTFRFNGIPTENEINIRMNHAVYNIHFDLNPLNHFDIDENFKDVLINLVKYIRNHSNCTFAQLKTVAETAYPDMSWKADKLIDQIKDKLREHYGFIPTFTQFKTYVINHPFNGVD